MRPAENIEKLIKNIDIDTNARMDKAVLDDALKALENSKKPALSKVEGTKSAPTRPNIWRIIMKNRMTKLASTAVVVAVAVFSIWLVNTGTTKVYGIDEVIQFIEQAKTLHVQGLYLAKPALVAEEMGEPLLFDYWYDFENKRYRRTWASFDLSEDIIETTEVFDGEYIMSILSSKSGDSVSFSRLNQFQSRLLMLTLGKSHLIGDLGQGVLAHIAGSVRVGDEKVEGTHYDIWECEYRLPHPTKEVYAKIRSWISPYTGELGKIVIWDKKDGEQWQWRQEVENFERDLTLDQDIFATEPPIGSKLNNTKGTAQTIELGGTGLTPLDETQYRLLIKIHIAFTLSDGSVIVCWRSRLATEPSQAEYFHNLNAGGNLPNLPLVIDALATMPKIEDLRYTGYHLAYTKKDDRYYEWSLYVTNNSPPARSAIFGYEALQTYNTSVHIDVDYNNNRIYEDLIIETKDEFNSWVLGAMAELSDDGIIPEHVTYDNVLNLVEEMKTTLKE
ncbi:MAG TPA: hypothetical protein HPP66_11870 [Planctomycetes bacterium]|nr:hypothetical protein [Planctomycetota bacterium]